MLTENGEHLYVHHEEYQRLIERLALQIHDSGWQFATIICLARGGLRPGDILSRLFRVPLAILAVSSYRDDDGTTQGELHMSTAISTTLPALIGPVLLVDDLTDSGQTLHAVTNMLRERHPAITELRTAVIWTKGISSRRPDYAAQHLPTSPWIHQPFEIYDKLSLQDLQQKNAKQDL
mgnify:FL=1